MQGCWDPPWIIILSHVRLQIVDRASSPLAGIALLAAVMSSTTMAKGVACSKPTAQAAQPQHQLLRRGMRTPAAFSSDRAPAWRKAQKSARRHQVHARRNNAVVLAAAATDVASTTVQAIKKSVGGDIFVAGAFARQYLPCMLS